MLKTVRAIGITAAIAFGVAACNGDTATGVGGLAFEATAAVVPSPTQNVVVTATITNISSGPVDVQYGCPVLSPVFHTGSLDGPVVYDTRLVFDCAAISVTKTLDPDEALTLQANASPGLPAGKYYVEAVIAVNGETVSIGAGTVTF